jgi:MOSC domain-containing protein YiiM/N-acetylglutamate synthase-like GNAT family acetyltransferase
VTNGRVLSVNLSPGGVPKLPVDRAWVGELGLDGDAHHDDTDHGGPLRAVCLFGVEVIERLRAEGHPLAGPGAVGENLTTEGVEWSEQPAGTRIRVGERLLLEIVKPAAPCETQRHNFIDGRFARMSIKLHPSDSRMYARVVEPGEVRPGDAFELLPPQPSSDIDDQLLMDRADAIGQRADLRLWKAAATSGIDIRVMDDGDLWAAAAVDAQDDHFSKAEGLRALPHLLPRLLDFYRSTDSVGWIGSPFVPWPGAEPDFRLATLVADPADVEAAPVPEGFSIRRLTANEAQAWIDVITPVADEVEFRMAIWRPTLRALIAERGVHVLVGERDGVPVACGALHVQGGVGLLRTGIVLPEARGHGLQRTLISARSELARELECDLVVSEAPPGSVSAGNLQRLGFRPIAERGFYRFDPAADPAPHLAERAVVA